MSRNILEIADISKLFQSKTGAKHALKNVSFSIEHGEVFGLLGVNGAGKTTLSNIIATLHPPTSGDVRFNGKSIYTDLMNYRMKLGFCPQKANFEKMLSVRENLLFAGRYFSMPTLEIEKRTEALLAEFELKQYEHDLPDILSGGYKQRLLIARSLVHDPALLILDEPTVAMDPHIRRELWALIKGLKARGVTIILTTHYLDEAEELSDRVCILDKGQVYRIDTPDELKKSFNKSSLEDVFLHIIDEQKK